MAKRKNNNPAPTVAGEFPIGIFVEPAPSSATDAAFAEIREMNANFIVGQQSTTPAATDWALEKAQANGLKILVTDTGVRWIQAEWIAQNDDSGEGIYLRRAGSIGQTFTTPDVDDLSLAIVSFKMNGEWPAGTSVTLSVYDNEEKAELLARSTLTGPVGSRYPEFRFARMPVTPEEPQYAVAPNRTYYMEFSLDGAERLGPFATGALGGNSGGQAYVDGSPAAFDLYFQLTLKTSRGGSISAFSPTGRPSDAYIETLVNHYRDHPAVLGYNLIDEPFAELYPMMKETSERLKALDPDRMIYTNHYPLNETGDSYYSLEGTPPLGYEEYYDRWLATNPDMFSFDFYPFKQEEFDEKPYYQSLEFFRGRSLATGIDFWAYIQSADYEYFQIAEPNERQIRFQVYSTLAYGAKGYVYWTYGTPSVIIEGKEMCKRAIILKDGSRNATYEYAKKVNAEVLKLGPALLSLTSKEVFHTGGLPPWSRPLPKDFFWQPSEGDASVPLIVASFENEDGKVFVMVVSKDLEQARTVTFQVSGNPGTIREVCKATGEEIETTYNGSSGMLSVNLSPGDGKLYALGER